MHLSTHYYVLSLNQQICRLYEGFRDTLIDIQNGGFPFELQAGPKGIRSTTADSPLQEYFIEVDKRFSPFYEQDPLCLILLGKAKHMTLFKSISAYQETVIGTVNVDQQATEPDKLGENIWLVVKQALAGANQKTIQDLLAVQDASNVAVGIEAVGQWAHSGRGSALFVEEDYHVKGRFREIDYALTISEEMDIRDINNDAVDLVIDQVLAVGGKVVFVNKGALESFQRMAMLLSR